MMIPAMTQPHPALPDMALHALRAELTGDLVLPTDTTYDELRTLWNGRYDRHPALLVRPAHAADVAAVLRFARTYRLPVAVRGGGHSMTGLSANDAGLTLDLGLLKTVTVDPETHIVRAGGGVTAGELGFAVQEYGLAVPTGSHSTVGIGGLTTGGGFGYLMRKYGLTMDSLLEVEIVTADGQVRTASATENPDLFWAVRGGGGNFGVVTTFTYQAHEIGTMVLGGPLVYTLDKAAAALRHYRDFMATAPDALTLYAVFTTLPPAAPFPPHLQGQMVLLLDACYVGDLAEGQQAVQPLRDALPADLDMLGPLPYTVRLTMLDETAHHGKHHDVTNSFLHDLSDAAIDTLVAHIAQATTPLIAVQVARLGGAVARVAADATAFAYRDAPYMFWLPVIWMPGDDGTRHQQWMHGLAAAMQPSSTGGAYVNVLGDEGEEGIRRAYPPTTYAHLQAIKRQYDPENVFCGNQNIPPA
jgi:FAD/FMN-containing dehydrogenase